MKNTMASGALLLTLSAQTAHPQSIEEIRQQARSVCMIDVMSFCASSIPDETSIMMCMKARRAQLSAPCRQVFDAGMRSTRRRQQGMR